MKGKITNFIIYIIVFVIILASFIIPNKLFEIQDKNFEMEVYSENNLKNYGISVEAENIYLVKAIHDTESENSEVIISSREASEQIVVTNMNTIEQGKIGEIKTELKTLKQNNVIKNDNIFDNSKLLMNIVKKRYQKDEESYTINNISISANKRNYQMDIEEKTGKIIKLIFDKKNLNNTISKEEIIKNYIQYLDLNIIDDWTYDNNVMKSQKANISVSLIENVNTDLTILSVHSKETLSGNLIESVDIEN